MKSHDTEVYMEVGDALTAVFDASHRFLDGYLRGANLRTGQQESFPSYETEIVVRVLNSTVFENV